MSLENVPVALAERAYHIWIGPLAECDNAIAGIAGRRKVLAIADSNTERAAASFFAALDRLGIPSSRAVFPAGEASKTFETAARLCGEAVRARLDRSSLIAAVGGGVAGDLAGFVAAIYMRGIDFIQIPTSLLAMVDSSVGGKTAVDLPEGKNLAGAFHQPKLVLIDPELLRTLPRRELVGAMAEVVKYGVIFDHAFFEFLEKHADDFRGDSFDPALYTKIIRRSCELKAAVVADDEFEKGDRALLNYGHTFGHAAEALSNFSLSHGEAVSIGMAVAGELAAALGLWTRAEAARQKALLARIGLPTALPRAFSVADMLEMMSRDKKNAGGRLKLILPRAIGRAEVRADIETAAVAAAIEAAYD